MSVDGWHDLTASKGISTIFKAAGLLQVSSNLEARAAEQDSHVSL